MGNEQPIRGYRPQGLPRRSRTYESGRTCAEPGCETLLSTYNRRDKCWLHAERKIPRLRGRKPAPGEA
jgi:hypothetical protein